MRDAEACTSATDGTSRAGSVIRYGRAFVPVRRQVAGRFRSSSSAREANSPFVDARNFRNRMAS